MCAVPTLLLPLDGSLAGQDRDGVVTATGGGSVRYRAGRWANTQAAFVEEGQTNWVRNPAPFYNLGDINHGGMGTRDTAVTFTDPRSGRTYYTVRMDCPGNPYDGVDAGAYNVASASTDPRTFTMQAWVLFPVGYTFHFVARIYCNGYAKAPGTTKAYTGTGTWQYLEATVTSAAGDTVDDARPWIVLDADGGSKPAVTFWATAFQTEERPYATSFMTGDMGPGYSWLGTPYGSPTWREGGKVIVPTAGHITASQGELLWWYQPSSAAWVPPSGQFNDLFNCQAVGNEFLVFVSGPNLTAVVGASATPMFYAIPDPTDLRWRLLGLSWAVGTKSQLLLDGVVVNTSANVLTQPLNLNTVALFGAGDANDQGIVGPIMSFDRPLTDAERTTLYQATQPWTWGILLPKFGGVVVTIPPDPLACAVTVPPEPLAVAVSTTDIAGEITL